MSRSISAMSIVVPNGSVGGTAISGIKISQNAGVHQGEITLFKIVTPNFTNPITTIVSLLDRNDVPKWTSDSLLENTTYAIYPAVAVPIEYGEYFTATPSGDPGAGGGTVTINAEYKPDTFIEI